MPAPKILVFSGSTRAGSLNQRLADVAATAIGAAGGAVTALTLKDYPLPIYDGDLEVGEGVPAAAVRLREAIGAHQGLFISTPEYNSGYPPLLKNALDWATRGINTPLLFDKVIALGAASPEMRGGYRALTQLRTTLELGFGALVIPEMVSLANAAGAFDVDGGISDPRSAAMMTEMAKRLVRTASHVIPSA